MTKSKIFLFLCLSFVFGIALSSFLIIPQLLLLGFLILGILLVAVLWPYKKLVVLGFCLMFLVLGIWRHQLVEIKAPEEGSVTLIGSVAAEPDVRESNTKLTIKSKGIDGKILVTVNRYPEYRYGDQLKIIGQLQTPHIFEDFNYQAYLAKDGIYSVMYFPEIELIEKKTDQALASIIYGKILQLKDKLRESIYQNLSPPQSSILAAVILGDKRRMSEDLKGKLNVVGVRHITAISGMHIMILSGILIYLAMAWGLSRSHSFYFTLVLLFLFIIMIGLPASAVRAGLMGGLFLLAQKVGRPKSASRAIIFAATLMLAVNPLLLKLDVGFQLSFLAIMGIIYLMPLLQQWLKFRILSMTLAAQVFTLPILIYNFGYISLVAPLTNILIVPLLPFIMMVGFIFALAGIFFQPLGWILSWPAWLLLTYLTKIVDGFNQIPLSSVTLEISWIWLLFFYLILSGILWRLNKRQKVW